MKAKQTRTQKVIEALATGKPVPPLVVTRKQLKVKAAQARAIEKLGFDPFIMGRQMENWCKGVQWHGVPEMKKLCAEAGFDLPKLVVHLEAMLKRLKSNA